MHIESLNIEEFTNYQKNHPLSSFYQTINYGMLGAENGYDYELIGLIDEERNIQAASLILIKQLTLNLYYGYAPRGFLIDYKNPELMAIFTRELKNYYLNKKVIFIKVNPNLPIGEVNKENYTTIYNENYDLINILTDNGFKKLKDNLYFEAALPRFNAFINLKKYDYNNFSKNTKNKIRKGIRKGLTFNIYPKEYLDKFYNLIKNKEKEHNEFYFQDIYTVFNKNEAIDLFLVSVDYNQFLENSQYIYDTELLRNNKLNEKITIANSEKNINTKMESDKTLLSYKNDIMEATKGLSENKKIYLAGALCLKHNNMVTILYSAYDKEYKRFVPNYFLYYSIIKYYADKFDILDLNGVVGDFNNNNDYTGLNNFKLGFEPQIFEFIGEYDFIINPKIYDFLLKNGVLSKIFNK